MNFLGISFICFVSGFGVLAQVGPPPNTFPQNYTGIPAGDYGTEWQSYYEVTESLPNVTDGSLPRSFAGSMSVNRDGHPNNTLFFWGFEKENGSLTANAGERSDEPWLIWLNGGPGSSSLLGFMTENGPLHVKNDYSIVQNNFSWNRLADAIWVDQPVGTGYSTSDTTGYISNEDQMGEDFLGFLSNLVKVFPSLAERPFFLIGESYAGVYIPYITKTIFSSLNSPVNLRKIAIGDGTIGAFSVFEELPVLTIIETYPQLINFDQEVFAYFKTQEHLCGYDLNLTYPQNGTFPTIDVIEPTQDFISKAFLLNNGAPSSLRRDSWDKIIAQRYAAKATAERLKPAQMHKRDLQSREEKRTQFKRDLTGRSNNTIDPFYGCLLLDSMVDYAVNFSFPWTNGGFDVYDIPDALNPEASPDPFPFLNDNRTRAALHAPTSKNWTESFDYPFGSTFNGGDPSVEPMAFFSQLATNASAHNVSIIIYSGNDDSLVSHKGSEVTIQNTTFGDIQGFTRKPSTSWFDDEGNFAGIVHQERNLTYVLFAKAGHLVPQLAPEATFVFLREFVLGDNTTGLVTSNGVIGGENSTFLHGDIIPGQDVIFYGSGTTASSTVAPTASMSAWLKFLQTATAVPGTGETSSAIRTHGSLELGLFIEGLLLISAVLTLFGFKF